MIRCFVSLIILCVAIVSCSPKASISKFSNTNLEPWDDELGFAVLEKNAKVEPTAIKVGLIRVGEGGMTVGCDYGSMINLIIEKAKANGANLVRVMEHKEPDYWSTCHRIKAFAYRVEDVSEYEKWIKWSPARPLTAKVFKASAENRPLDFRTISRMMYSWKQVEGRKIELRTWAEFSCSESYISKTMIKDTLGLAIQQLLFDNTEVYSRSILKEVIDKDIYDFNRISEELSPVADRIVRNLDKRADLITVEIARDRSNYARWRAQIDKELRDLIEYDDQPVRFIY